jgi:hypothetical protein
MIMDWTLNQWIMFVCFAIAGQAALGLIGITVRDRRARALAAGGPVAVTVDPTAEILAHLAPGPGSLATLAEVGEGSLTREEPPTLVPADVRDALAFVFDRPAYAPSQNEAGVVDDGGALTRFQIAMEPIMRKARLWELQGHAQHRGGASAWVALDHLRMDTPTGEYALIPG